MNHSITVRSFQVPRIGLGSSHHPQPLDSSTLSSFLCDAAMLSPSASSSAVTIPTPGKSILKRPPPPQQSFFSLARLSKLLPTPNQQPSTTNDEATALKRAHFILPEMTTVYPILAANPPSTPSLKEEKRSIEERELERRKRIVRGNNTSSDSHLDDDWWGMDKVEAFYRECCMGREEIPDPAISVAFKVRIYIVHASSTSSHHLIQ